MLPARAGAGAGRPGSAGSGFPSRSGAGTVSPPLTKRTTIGKVCPAETNPRGRPPTLWVLHRRIDIVDKQRFRRGRAGGSTVTRRRRAESRQVFCVQQFTADAAGPTQSWQGACKVWEASLRRPGARSRPGARWPSLLKPHAPGPPVANRRRRGVLSALVTHHRPGGAVSERRRRVPPCTPPLPACAARARRPTTPAAPTSPPCTLPALPACGGSATVSVDNRGGQRGQGWRPSPHATARPRPPLTTPGAVASRRRRGDRRRRAAGLR